MGEYLITQPPFEHSSHMYGSEQYNFFVRANARYEQHLATTCAPGKSLLPRGTSHEYAGVPIEDVPQDDIWWALRPSNRHQAWYQPLNDANKRFLDDVYKSRSPGSEPIWFGKRYKGLRLDQVYQRRSFIRWCFDPQRRESGWLYRFKDLVLRLEDWRMAHPERSGPRQRRKVPNIQNPVGEAIGPWDDSLGSAGEDEYDKDSFVQSDEDELEYSSGIEDELMDDGDADNDLTRDSSESTSSSVEMTPSVHKRTRTNVVLSDEEDPEEASTFAGKLGRQYRVPYESSEEEVFQPDAVMCGM
ncbi:hypothetical protein J3R83DRAFT_5221 [Lanmaoa asiatica]|nr:hypothetical protein J3R83DRAFT_5221 [Lanmaoa asiatica]